MENQKLEQLLQLSVSLTNTEREKSQVLSAGFTPEEKTWDLIFKYHGTLFPYASDKINPVISYGTWRIIPLIAGYGIISLPESDIETFASLPEIEYIEIPKELFF